MDDDNMEFRDGSVDEWTETMTVGGKEKFRKHENGNNKEGKADLKEDTSELLESWENQIKAAESELVIDEDKQTVVGSNEVWSKCEVKDIKSDDVDIRSRESRAKTKMKECGRGRVLGKKPPKRGSARQLAAALKHGKKPPTKLLCLDNMEYEVVIHVKWKSDDKAKNVSVADLEESEGTSGTKRGSARLLAAALKVQ